MQQGVTFASSSVAVRFRKPFCKCVEIHLHEERYTVSKIIYDLKGLATKPSKMITTYNIYIYTLFTLVEFSDHDVRRHLTERNPHTYMYMYRYIYCNVHSRTCMHISSISSYIELSLAPADTSTSPLRSPRMSRICVARCSSNSFKSVMAAVRMPDWLIGIICMGYDAVL